MHTHEHTRGVTSGKDARVYSFLSTRSLGALIFAPSPKVQVSYKLRVKQMIELFVFVWSPAQPFKPAFGNICCF